MKGIAIIPARAGSIRVPGKNWREFCGRPLVEWTILAAQECEDIGEVFVTTDSEIIGGIAAKLGATVIMRDWITTDQETGTVPIARALEKVEREKGAVEWFAAMLPTGPNRLPGDLFKCFSAWQAGGRKGYGSFAINPKEMVVMLKVGESGGRCIIFDKNKSFWATGTGDCIITPEEFRANFEDQKLYGEYHIMPTINTYVPVEPWQTLEVDTPEQWDMCEFWFRKRILDVYGPEPYKRRV